MQLSNQGNKLKVNVLSSASGDNNSVESKTVSASSLNKAVAQVAQSFSGTLREGQKIAVLNILAQSAVERDFVLEELSFQLVETRRFSVVDRRSLDTIRKEQKFQLSGEVSDDSAVSIGQLLGAEVVITGSISGTDSLRRLRVKALDVRTGEIVAMESIKF